MESGCCFASTAVEDNCNIASDAWKAWADALKASKDIRNSASLVDANLLKAAIETSNSATNASALALKEVYESLVHHSSRAHSPHDQNSSTSR
jgi:hypothetical protein